MILAIFALVTVARARPGVSGAVSAPEKCSTDTVCSTAKKNLGKFSTVAECGAAVVANCDFADVFNYRTSNGACLCSTDGCATRGTSNGIDLYATGMCEPEDVSEPEKCAANTVCSLLQKVARFSTLAECRDAVVATCDFTDVFNYRASNGACLCSTDSCTTRGPSNGIDLYATGMCAPEDVSDEVSAPALCSADTICSSPQKLQKLGKFSTVEACGDAVVANCEFTNLFNYRTSNGACFCSTNSCETPADSDGVHVYATRTCVSKCFTDTVCSSVAGLGRFPTVEECGNVVVANCDFTDMFSYRTSNGACFCSTDSCALPAESDGVDIYSTLTCAPPSSSPSSLSSSVPSSSPSSLSSSVPSSSPSP